MVCGRRGRRGGVLGAVDPLAAAVAVATAVAAVTAAVVGGGECDHHRLGCVSFGGERDGLLPCLLRFGLCDEPRQVIVVVRPITGGNVLDPRRGPGRPAPGGRRGARRDTRCRPRSGDGDSVVIVGRRRRTATSACRRARRRFGVIVWRRHLRGGDEVGQTPSVGRGGCKRWGHGGKQWLRGGAPRRRWRWRGRAAAAPIFRGRGGPRRTAG